ncbi:polygalacturonate 4-alpha-galacturonosyltransferase [Tanacetum coccineum]
MQPSTVKSDDFAVLGKYNRYADLNRRENKSYGSTTVEGAKEQLYDCKLVTGKLGAMLQSADEQVRSLKKQRTFLGQLAAKTIPNSENLENPSLYHYALFFDNVVDASIVVNSTIMNAKVFSFWQATGMQ